MDETIRRMIVEILDRERIMTVATLRPDGWPHATTVGYFNEGLSLYFLCGLDSQKARNLAKDDRVSLAINNDPSEIMQINGLSMAGRVRPVENDVEAASLIARMPSKYPGSLLPTVAMPTPRQVRIFRVTPAMVSVLDYRQGFGHTDLVSV